MSEINILMKKYRNESCRRKARKPAAKKCREEESQKMAAENWLESTWRIEEAEMKKTINGESSSV